jgi:hypothetical protein
MTPVDAVHGYPLYYHKGVDNNGGMSTPFADPYAGA